MKRVRLVPAARRELRAASIWYEEREPGLGQEFLDEVGKTLRTVGEAPERHPMWHADRPYRRIRVKRFPYLVLYEACDDEVRVYAIAHARRKPGYWLRRVRRDPESG